MTVPRMRPVVVWANMHTETEKASTRQTRPIRTPFDEQRITTSEPSIEVEPCMVGHSATTEPKWKKSDDGRYSLDSAHPSSSIVVRPQNSWLRVMRYCRDAPGLSYG